MIPYSRQSIDDDDIAAVVSVLKGDWIVQGPVVEEFERMIAERVDARFAVAFANGTAALHGAMAAGGIGPGDRVLTSALTFVASANCARYVGASVDVVDIDPDTLLIDVTQIPACDALVAVHYAGLPVDLSRLSARPRVLIEDAAHALGADTPDGPVGNCARSDMCMFSFHPVKHVTTGEGGLITTNSSDLATRLRRFRSHGTVPAPSEGPWAYDVQALGFNYRLTDIQASLGVSQMAKLDRFLARRRQLADRYREMLAPLPVVLPPAASGGFVHAYHLFPIRVADRAGVYQRLRDNGVAAQVHYVPVYRHRLYSHLGPNERFPHTEAAYAGLLSLPLYPDLTDEQQDVVVHALEASL